MKRILLLFSAISILIVTANSASNYKLNNTEIDALFDEATELQISNFSLSNIQGINSGDIITISNEKEPLIAWLCTYTASFGICGVHRLYLGTEIITFVGYLITAGGCGIVQTVDWIVLLIELIDQNKFDQYIDNPKFFMWL